MDELTDEQLRQLWYEDQQREQIESNRSEAEELQRENELFNWNIN